MPAVNLRLGAADAARIRFGISAPHELTRAVAVLLNPAAHPLQWGWLRRVRADVPADALAVAATVIPPHGYTPDFLAPPPVEPAEPAEQIAAVARTPLDVVRRDLVKCRGLARGSRRARIDAWLADPRTARRELAGAWNSLWTTLLAPWWPEAARVLDADLAYRARLLVAGGTAAMITELHERISWHDESIRIATAVWTEELDCRGIGVLLVPSVFSWPGCSVITQRPQQPTVFYPALGVTEAWPMASGERDRHLAVLLGHGRASVLIALLQPSSTTVLARRCALSAPTVTHHVTALRDAGLVTTTTQGRQRIHALTALGASLVHGS